MNILNINTTILKYSLLISIPSFVASCSKRDEFLNKKPSNSLIVPTKLSEYQALMDEDGTMSGGSNGPAPSFLDANSDNYYLTDNVFLPLVEQARNQYLWNSDDIFTSNSRALEWAMSYKVVMASNVAIDGLKKIERTALNKKEWDNVQGSALFHRAYRFYDLLQVFSLPLDKQPSSEVPGIPLRLSSDVNEVIKRNSQAECFEKITSDLKEAAGMLPDIPVVKTRPSKHSAYALLSRIYLSVNDYEQAKIYADSCLSISSELTSYSDLNLPPNSAIPRLSKEVIFHMLGYYGLLIPVRGYCAPELYSSYDDNDLRKTYYFRTVNSAVLLSGVYSFSASSPFTGLAVDEILLNRAECFARDGKKDEALADLNKLLTARYVAGTFTPLTALSAEEALELVLRERRKELPFRGLRWLDIKRFNKLGANITLRRTINGVEYTLPPNSPRNAWPIPPEVIAINPNIQQNTW